MVEPIPRTAQVELPSIAIQAVLAPHIEYLARTPRYDRYMNGESLEEWADLLGPDVILLTHPQIQEDIAREMLEFPEGQQLSSQESVLLITCARVHNLGEIMVEGVGIGDISYEYKRSDHEVQEARVFELVIAAIPDGAEKEFIRRAYYQVAMDTTTPLGELFNITERIGYLRTALRAWEGQGGRRIHNWAGLAGNVLSLQIESLLSHAQHEFVRAELVSRSAQISQAFAEISEKPPSTGSDGNAFYRTDRLLQNHSLWTNYTA